MPPSISIHLFAETGRKICDPYNFIIHFYPNLIYNHSYVGGANLVKPLMVYTLYGVIVYTFCDLFYADIFLCREGVARTKKKNISGGSMDGIFSLKQIVVLSDQFSQFENLHNVKLCSHPIHQLSLRTFQ